MNAARRVAPTGRPQAPDRGSLLAALRDFERSPGRYRVVLREPRPLFEQVGSVMQLASGRPVKGLPVSPASAAELRRAARFFVRTVMLRPGADPLTLLGLKPGFEPAQRREHYRLMIRLTHPDFGVEGGDWPADAATRINMANDWLSSPAQGSGHTAALPTPAATAGAPLRRRPVPSGAPWPRGGERTGHWPPRARLALAAMGAVLMAGALLLASTAGQQASLTVQRVVPTPQVASPDGRPGGPGPAPGTPAREAVPP